MCARAVTEDLAGGPLQPTSGLPLRRSSLPQPAPPSQSTPARCPSFPQGPLGHHCQPGPEEGPWEGLRDPLMFPESFSTFWSRGLVPLPTPNVRSAWFFLPSPSSHGFTTSYPLLVSSLESQFQTLLSNACYPNSSGILRGKGSQGHLTFTVYLIHAQSLSHAGLL